MKRKMRIKSFSCVLFLCVLLFSCSNGSNGVIMQEYDVYGKCRRYTVDELMSLECVSFQQSLMLINKQYKIDGESEFDIVEYKDTDVFMNSCMTEKYGELSKAVSDKFSEKLYVMDAYRSAEDQEQAIIEQGDKAAGVNESEHQAGLALDVYVKYYAGAAFLKTETGKFVNSDCWQYGFIIRYPSYGEKITGISHEVWHIRYVGEPHAEIIMKNKLTLEEYIQGYEIGKTYSYGDHLITRRAEDDILLPDFQSAVVSKDNTGYYIITMKIQ
ncbi:MAG: M15 family metallopeptidase [Clostridia bacterium]|nr:M15 family metallopeptidase [Clostridia bacterium]